MGGRMGRRTAGTVARLIVVCAIACGLAGACSTSDASRDVQGCLVGATWSWARSSAVALWEQPALQKAVVAAGATYKSTDAMSNPSNQVQDIDALIASGAKVIVVEPTDLKEIGGAVQRATDAGILVLTLSRPVNNPKAVYVGFDPVEAGRLQAKALLAAKPKGNYVVVRFDSTEPEGDLFAAGVQEILKPAVDRGDIKVVATLQPATYGLAFVDEDMKNLLSQKDRPIDAVVAENDEISQEIRATVEAAGLSGKVAVGGAYNGGVYDAQGTGLVGLARGTQAVDVWGNPELLGAAVARAAIARCGHPDATTVDGSAPLAWPGYGPTNAILLPPVAITKDNLDVVTSSGWLWRGMVCDYVEPAEVPSCGAGADTPPPVR